VRLARQTSRSWSLRRRLPLSIPPAWRQVLDFFGAPQVIERSPDQISGDAGLLPVGLSDRGIGFARAFDALDDPLDTDLTEQSFPAMLRARLFGAPPTTGTRAATMTD
jgi:hypothetical protein